MSREKEAMGCRLAFDVDLVACLLDRSRPEWEAFRDHYPTCAECTTEVRTWTELQAELAPAHPEPADLVRYEDEPASLPDDERHAIRDHVATCTACRDELHMLRTTDLPALVRAGTAVVTPTGAPPRHVRAPRRRLGARIGRIVWHPGFAYAVAILLIIPALAPHRDALLRMPTSIDALRAASHGSDESDRPRRESAMAKQRAAAPAPPPAEYRRKDAFSDAAAPMGARVPANAAPTKPDEVAAERLAPVVAGQATATPVWPRLDMTPTSSHLVIAASPGLIVSLPAPGDAVTAGPAELRIRDGSGRRELRESYFGPPTRRVTMRVPGEWLEPGRYVVELWTGDKTPAVTATLDVAARTDR